MAAGWARPGQAAEGKAVGRVKWGINSTDFKHYSPCLELWEAHRTGPTALEKVSLHKHCFTCWDR